MPSIKKAVPAGAAFFYSFDFTLEVRLIADIQYKLAVFLLHFSNDA
jgi:hypothetical protein